MAKYKIEISFEVDADSHEDACVGVFYHMSSLENIRMKSVNTMSGEVVEMNLASSDGHIMIKDMAN